MPDNFFRTVLYSFVTVALVAAGIILVKNVATGDAEAYAHATPAGAVATSRQVSVDAGEVAPALTQYHPRAMERRQQPVMRPRAEALSAHSTNVDAPFAASRVPADASRVTSTTEASRPVIHVGSNAVELTVPVHPQSGVQARVPVALALAADPAGMSPQVQEAARQMAMDFLENVADVAAVADGARDAAYFERWQRAADLSDSDFRMRYGRIAYVQMNQAVAQEAAAGVR